MPGTSTRSARKKIKRRLDKVASFRYHVFMKANNEMVITIYIDKQDASKFKAQCALEGKSMTAILREMISKYLRNS